MMSRIALVLSLVFLSLTAAPPVSGTQSSADQDPKLAGTIYRYFSSISDYQEGNLICRSQVEELQRYLRRTQGSIPASHRRLLNRVLADEAPLSQFFYGENGEAVLCDAAVELAGYEELEVAARTTAGRKLIKAAIRSNESDALVQYLKQEIASKKSQQSQQAGQQEAKTSRARIYTVEQFIEAALASPNSGEKQVSASPERPPARVS